MRKAVLPIFLLLIGCSDDASPGGGGAGGSSSGGASSSGGSSSGGSSSGGSSSGGSSSGGATSSECSFTGTFSGGVEGPIVVNGCGASGDNRFSVAQADITKRTSLGVRFIFVNALRGGELGPQPIEALEIFKLEGPGTEELVWRATTCTIELTKNQSSPTEVFKNRFLLEGKGSCTGPFEPVAPNTRANVTVTPFTFGAFIDPD